MTRNEYQKRGREKLHEPDHAEIERASGEIIDLPADRHRPDLARKTRQAPRQQEQQELSLAEQRAGADRHHGGHVFGRFPLRSLCRRTGVADGPALVNGSLGRRSLAHRSLAHRA